MSKRKWTREEIENWRKEHYGNIGYFNKEDSNVFIPKASGFGWTVNFANPITWIIVAAFIGFIIWNPFK